MWIKEQGIQSTYMHRPGRVPCWDPIHRKTRKILLIEDGQFRFRQTLSNFPKLVRADFVHRDIICLLFALMRICADIYFCVWKLDDEICQYL
jgi:hypothetical protein